MAGSIAALLLIVGVAVWSWQNKPARPGTNAKNPLEGLQFFGSVPDFSFVERSGSEMTLTHLRGKIWIANFIYTNCPDTCPIQSARMKALQDEFSEEADLRLVSITVDPDRDTPEVLEAYADSFGADLERWLFLTGEKEIIHRFAQEGFRLGAAQIAHEHRAASGATHTHSPRFVLIDGDAQIRGYYTSTDPEALGRLRQDMRTLLGK